MVDVSVRLAAAADLTVVWEWRNDSDTRAASFQGRPIPLDEHRAWFMSALLDPRRRLLIAEIAESATRIGIVRFDLLHDAEWSIHVNLAPQWRGRRLAADVLRRALQWLTVHEAVGSVFADVRATNDRSLRAFLAAGFERGDETSVRTELRWRATPQAG